MASHPSNTTLPSQLEAETVGHETPGSIEERTATNEVGATASEASGNSSLYRTASQMAGFQQSGQQPVRPEELVEQGVPATLASARVVRQHENEVLQRHFMRWLVLFGLVMLLMIPTMLGLLIWLLVAFANYNEVRCDVPLGTYVYGVLAVIWLQFLNSCVQRFICLYVHDPENPQAVPLRVKMYNFGLSLLTFLWHCTALYWVSVDGQKGMPCKELASPLYEASKVYAAMSVASTIFVIVNMVGVSTLLRLALRNGLLTTNNAAPAGAIDANTISVASDDPELESLVSCPICMEDYVGNTPAKLVARTKSCDHVFHKECLKNWFKVNRTCPLCRTDLG